MTERKQTPELEVLSQISLLDAFRKTAERLESLGFDAQRTIERLPEIIEKIEALADDLEAELNQRFCGTLEYPNLKRRYDRDMEPVLRIRTLLTACRKDSND